MKNMIRRALAGLILAAAALSFAACGDGQKPPPSGDDSIVDREKVTATIENPDTYDVEDYVESEFWKNFVTITFGDTVKIQNSNEAEIDVQVQGGNVAVTSAKKMQLTLRGTLRGSVLVTKPDGKLKLVLDGADIRSDSGPAINLQTEKRVFVVLADGSVNTLTDGSEHPLLPDGSKTKAALFSREQLIFSGGGALRAEGRYSHAIASNDYLRIRGGDYQLRAVNDGLRANDRIIVDGGNIRTQAGSDGMECERGNVVLNGGSLALQAEGCGIKAAAASPVSIDILNGAVEIDAAEYGILSQTDALLRGGYLRIEAKGGGVKTTGKISVNDGYIFTKSSNGSGMDAEQGLFFAGGTILSLAANSKAYDAHSANFIIAGGTVAGAAGNLFEPDENSSQQALLFENAKSAKLFHAADADGKGILTLRLDDVFQWILLSAPQIRTGNVYSLYLGGSVAGKNFHGLYGGEEYRDQGADRSQIQI